MCLLFSALILPLRKLGLGFRFGLWLNSLQFRDSWVVIKLSIWLWVYCVHYCFVPLPLFCSVSIFLGLTMAVSPLRMKGWASSKEAQKLVRLRSLPLRFCQNSLPLSEALVRLLAVLCFPCFRLLLD